MNEYSNTLKAILKDLNDVDVTVSDEEYKLWKEKYELMEEHEKVFNLLAVLSQYLTSNCTASASILSSAVICTGRWCDEKDAENF